MNTEQQARVARISRTPITMMAVVSSQIAAIGHDPNTDTLAIRFNPRKDRADEQEQGPLYHYGNVTPETFKEFQGAPSIGSFFYARIKPDTESYPYIRIDPPAEEVQAEQQAANDETPSAEPGSSEPQANTSNEAQVA